MPAQSIQSPRSGRFRPPKRGERTTIDDDLRCMIKHVSNVDAVALLKTYLKRLPITRLIHPEDIPVVVSDTRGILTLKHLKSTHTHADDAEEDFLDMPQPELVNLILGEMSSRNARIELCRRYISSMAVQRTINLERITYWTVRESIGVYLEYARQINKVDSIINVMATLTAEKISCSDKAVLALISMKSVLV